MKYSRHELDFEEFGILFDSANGEAGSNRRSSPKSSPRSLERTVAWRSDVLVVRLINGEKTMLHAVHWAAFLSVAQSNEEWQQGNLGKETRIIWDLTVESGKLHYPDIPSIGNSSTQTYMHLLEALLLVHSPRLAGGQDLIESWASWSKRVGIQANMSAEDGRLYFEELLEETGVSAGSSPFPWSRWQDARSMMMPAPSASNNDNLQEENDDRGDLARFSCQRADNSLHHLEPVGVLNDSRAHASD